MMWLLLLLTALAGDRYRVETSTLPSGDIVVLVPDDRAPLVQVVMWFDVGAGSEWAREHDAETAWLLQRADPEHTLQERGESLAAEVTAHPGWWGMELSARCLRDDLPAVLELIADVLRNDSFDPRELRRRVASARISRRSARKDPEAQRAWAVTRATFPPGHPTRTGIDHPYRPTRNLDALVAARDRVASTRGRVVSFAGDITLDEAIVLLDGVLPEASAEAIEPEWPEGIVLLDRKDEVVRLPRLTQAYVSWYRDGLVISHPDYPAFLVADHVLAGHFHSRLYSALRHEGGQTYGVGSRGGRAPVSTPYQLVTFTRSDNRSGIELSLMDAVEVFRADGITAEELEAAVSSLQGSARMREQGPWSAAADWRYGHARGVGPDFQQELLRRVGALELDEVNDFIRGFFLAESFRWVSVVGR